MMEELNQERAEAYNNRGGTLVKPENMFTL